MAPGFNPPSVVPNGLPDQPTFGLCVLRGKPSGWSFLIVSQQALRTRIGSSDISWRQVGCLTRSQTKRGASGDPGATLHCVAAKPGLRQAVQTVAEMGWVIATT